MSFTKRARKRGPSLWALLTMPLDILYEILRAVVLSRSATSAWKRSFSAVEAAPSIPDDISIPHLASLMFENFCQYCLKYAPTVYWECRARVCKHCLYIHYLVSEEAVFDLELLMCRTIRDVCPAAALVIGYTRQKTYLPTRTTFIEYCEEYRQLRNANADDVAIKEVQDQEARARMPHMGGLP